MRCGNDADEKSVLFCIGAWSSHSGATFSVRPLPCVVYLESDIIPSCMLNAFERGICSRESCPCLVRCKSRFAPSHRQTVLSCRPTFFHVRLSRTIVRSSQPTNFGALKNIIQYHFYIFYLYIYSIPFSSISLTHQNLYLHNRIHHVHRFHHQLSCRRCLWCRRQDRHCPH